MSYKIFEYDPGLLPYRKDIELRMSEYERKRGELLQNGMSLLDFANAHEYFGFHKTKDGWVYREWAPAADALYLVGDMNGWSYPGIPMNRLAGGVFERIVDQFADHAIENHLDIGFITLVAQVG